MQYWINITKKILAVGAIVLISQSLKAQENSPYSRYALGNLKQTENVANRGMGGVSLADDNFLIANPTNPATYTGLKMTCYQFSLEGSSVNIKNSNGANRTGSATLSYVNIGFPVSKKMGMSFGLMPQTRSRYQMQDITTLNNISQVTTTYYGVGGLQRIYVGTAYKIKDFSIGANVGYNFGNKANNTEAEFTDSLKILSSFISTRYSMGGVFWQLGGLWSKKIKNDYTLNAAMTYIGNQTLNAKLEQEYGSYVGILSNNPEYQHNVDSISNVKGKIKIPSNFGAGLLLKNGDYWQAGIDFTSANWANYSSYGAKDSTTNTWALKVGFAITPDVNSVTSSFKRMTYRVGAYHGQDIFSFNGNTLSKTGITAGFGFPIKRTNASIGQINAAFDFGKRGSVDNGMIREGYTRFSIGLTLNDKWFLKRKYD